MLAWVIWRLPEPARGGCSRIPAGATEVPAERKPRAAAEQGAGTRARGSGQSRGQEEEGLAQQVVRHSDVQPEEELILREEPTDRSIWWALRYVLRVRTNVIIILASALGYFYFAGLRSFAVLFATSHYGISKPLATSLIVVIGAGALAGVYVGGRVSDRLLRRGHLRIRVILPACCLVVLPPVLDAGLAARSAFLALARRRRRRRIGRGHQRGRRELRPARPERGLTAARSRLPCVL